MHGHIPVGIIFGIAQTVFAGSFFYFLYQITKSLKHIASYLENK